MGALSRHVPFGAVVANAILADCVSTESVDELSVKEYEDGITPPGITVNVAELVPAGR